MGNKKDFFLANVAKGRNAQLRQVHGLQDNHVLADTNDFGFEWLDQTILLYSAWLFSRAA